MNSRELESGSADEAVAWFVRLQDCDDEAVWIAHSDWLEADAANAAAYARVEAAWVMAEDSDLREALRVDPVASPPSVIDFVDARATRRKAWLWVPTAVAASLVAMIAWPPRQAAQPATTYRTDATHLQDINLVDGSHITLNRDTVLTTRNDDRSRAVALIFGEAAFDVRHDATRPLTIAVAGRKVRVLGTAFGVTSRNGTFGISVSRGAVSVSAAGNLGKPVILPAGKALSRLRGAAEDEIADVAPENVVAWKTGELSYTDATLGTVARDYQRLIGLPVLVDPAIRDLPISGIFRARDETDLIRQLELVLPIRVIRASAGRRIMRKLSS